MNEFERFLLRFFIIVFIAFFAILAIWLKPPRNRNKKQKPGKQDKDASPNSGKTEQP